MGSIQPGGLRAPVKVRGYKHRHLDTNDLLPIFGDSQHESLGINELIVATDLDEDTVRKMIGANVHRGYLEEGEPDLYVLTEDGKNFLQELLDGDPEEVDDDVDSDDS